MQKKKNKYIVTIVNGAWKQGCPEDISIIGFHVILEKKNEETPTTTTLTSFAVVGKRPSRPQVN